MPQGSISSSDDAVGVAVVNYQVPVVETKNQVLDNCKRIASFVDGMKRGYPGMDLIVFPEYTTQGFHPTKWSDLTTTLTGDEMQIFGYNSRLDSVQAIVGKWMVRQVESIVSVRAQKAKIYDDGFSNIPEIQLDNIVLKSV